MIIKDIRKIINNTDFILGKSTKKFEKSLPNIVSQIRNWMW